MHSRQFVLRLAASWIFITGCTNDSPNDDRGENDGGSEESGDAPYDSLPAFSELSADTWNFLEPGGDTLCARGTPFGFYVWPGRTDKLVINFGGGGACWDEATCSILNPTFYDDFDVLRDALEQDQLPGLFDMENPDNPIADATHVLVPYCTGDVHVGNSDTAYNDSTTVYHRGAVNSQAVLNWVFANLDAPQDVLTTGCSAGGYGALLWSTTIMETYPQSHHIVFADSAAGVLTNRLFDEVLPTWNASPSDFIAGLDNSSLNDITDLYGPLTESFPDATFAQYNVIHDRTQVLFYAAMGGQGGADGWLAGMRDVNFRIANTASNYRYFIGSDAQETPDIDESTIHCIIEADRGNPTFNGDAQAAVDWSTTMLLTYEVEGVRFIDWLNDLLGPRAESGRVACEGCEPEPQPR